MYDSIGFVNANAASVNLLDAGFTLGVKGLAWKYEMAGEDFGKQGESGNHPAAVVVRKLLVTLNGQIKGASPTEYWANRSALLTALLPDEGAPVSYYTGRLHVAPTGGTAVYADVVMVDNDFTSTVDEGTKTSLYTVNWRCDRGYWSAESDDSLVKL